MSSPLLSCTNRSRRTPFSNKVEAAGVKAYTVYNHMLLPTIFSSMEEDYAHLKKAVQVWDVSCQRQVEIVGPDAHALLQMSTPRNLSKMPDDQCYYIPMVDQDGFMLNDPVAIKLDENRFWVSVADNDVKFYFMGLANGLKLNVDVFEPDVSPLSIQGPKSVELVERVFGREIAETKFFKYKKIIFSGKEMIIARSGWSHQACFEIYLDGSSYGESLWDEIFKAGKDLDVRAGCPNLIERIESGLLSFGNDVTLDHTPYEAGLGKYFDSDMSSMFLGYKKLINKRNPSRIIKPIQIEGEPINPLTYWIKIKDENNLFAGYISSAVWSPEFKKNIAIGMVEKDFWNKEINLYIVLDNNEKRKIVLKDDFWS